MLQFKMNSKLDSLLKISASCVLLSITVVMCQEFLYKKFEKEMYMKSYNQ